MKRLFSFFLALSLLICFIPNTVHAAETKTTILYFEDGSYMITKLEVSSSRMITKVGSMTRTYYSASDVPQWKIVVTGEFLYDGSTSTCTYATGTYAIYENDYWQYLSSSSSYGGNTATYTATLARVALGITIDRPSFSVSVSCDENGNLY